MSRGFVYDDARAGIERTTKRRTPQALADALRRLEGRLGPATEDDRPPCSTFPLTRAAREALRLSRGRVV